MLKKLFSTKLLLIFIFVLLLILLFEINEIKKIPNYSDLQIWSVGKYYIENSNNKYNSLKKEYDYYLCLDNSRVMYEHLWKEHCKDLGKDSYCMLLKDIQDDIRINYERAKNECYE